MLEERAEMTFRRARPRFLAVAVACALAPACSSTTPAPHGSPVLTQVYWVAGSDQFLVWSRVPDPAQRSPVPPFASEVDFVFDRRLDGARLEDITTVDGVVTVTPKQPPSVRVSWPDMANAMSDPPFDMTVDYNSAARFGGISSYVFARPVVPGFPASSLLTFELVPELLTSEYGEPATVPASIPVKTSAFTVTIGSPTAPVVRGYQLPLSFSNRVPAPPATSPFVHVRLGGADVPYKLLADASLASRWYLAAADCLAGWPASATLSVTVDADLADAFGEPLGQASTATFSTGASGAAGVATCSIPDAGAGDGSVDTGDAGADVSGASDAPASETTPDGAAADAPDGGAPDGAVPDATLEAGEAADAPDAGAADGG
jgi:hypothetical protein